MSTGKVLGATMKGSPVMAHSADLVLIPPASTSEAALRIQEALPGAKAKGHLEITIPPKDLIPLMYGGERPGQLFSWEFGSVDVTEFLENLCKNPDGTLKQPGGYGSGWGDPMIFDSYYHDDVPDDEVVFTAPSNANPHLGGTGRRPVGKEPVRLTAEEWLVLKGREGATITADELVEEFKRSGRATLTPKVTQNDQVTSSFYKNEDEVIAGRAVVGGEGYHTSQPHLVTQPKQYEPLPSGVWIDTAVNEDDIKELHPDPQLDGPLKESEDVLDQRLDKLVRAVEELARLIKGA